MGVVAKEQEGGDGAGGDCGTINEERKVAPVTPEDRALQRHMSALCPSSIFTPVGRRSQFDSRRDNKTARVLLKSDINCVELVYQKKKKFVGARDPPVQLRKMRPSSKRDKLSCSHLHTNISF